MKGFIHHKGDGNESMDIGKAEYSLELQAKTYGCNENRTVAYSIVESFHGLCIGKKSILLEQIEACERYVNIDVLGTINTEV